MKRFATLTLAAVCLVGAAQAVVITQWNFNSISPDGLTSTGTTTPSIGTGTASLLSGVTATFASGDTEAPGSSDPATGDDSGWNTANYSPTLPNKTGGAQFLVSTVGFEDIIVSFDVRKSNTGSRFIQFQYTTNGTVWNDFGAAFDHTSLAWFNLNTSNLSAIGAVENNANFGIRLVAAQNAGGVYEAAGTGSTFGAAGTLRYDMVTISGTAAAVPEPASMAVLGVGALALIRRRRSSK